MTDAFSAPSSQEVGAFVDGVAGPVRTPAAVAGRLLEEAVELALAAGATTGDIFGHVADALHNQALKASHEGPTVFPSQLVPVTSIEELSEECADVHLLLMDLCHVARIELGPVAAKKWAKFTAKRFRVADNGTIYAVKPHVVAK